jgi:putative redox protein
MQMHVQAQWTSGMRFEGANADGLGVVMDADPQHGGTAGGPSPMETLLLALAGCTGMDVVPILQKMRAPVDRFTIEVTADRAGTHPKVLTAIHLRYVAAGPGLRAEQVEKAVALSQDKYCSVSAMLRKAASVTYDTTVIDTRAEQPSLAAPAR